MAEALLGVVSAGAGLASLSMQLLESAQRLKAFYDDAKSAPRMLNALSEDLRTIAALLQTIEHYQLRQNVREELVLRQCVTSVERTANDITKTVRRLEDALGRRRTLGRLATAFKEPEIQKSLGSLEHAKSSLIIAHQLYMELQRQQESHKLQQLITSHFDRFSSPAVSRQPPAQLASVSRTDRTTDPVVAPAEAPVAQDETFNYEIISSRPPGPMSIEDRKLAKRRRPRQVLSIRIPPWLYNRAWDIALLRSMGVLTLSYHSWKVVNDDAPVIKHCRAGNLAAMRQLFIDGQATPRDRARYYSLLELAIIWGQFEICTFLLDTYGLRKELDAVEAAVVQLVNNACYQSNQIRGVTDMFRLLKASDMDIPFDEMNIEPSAIPSLWWACPDVESLNVMLRNQLVINSNQPPCRPAQLLEVPVDTVVTRTLSPGVLLQLFGIEWSPLGIARLTCDIKERLLHIAVQKVGDLENVPDGPRWPWSKELWKLLARDAIAHGAHAASVVDNETPLIRLLNVFKHDYDLFDFRANHLLCALQEWIGVLVECGIGLLEYKNLEIAAWGSIHFREKQAKAANPHYARPAKCIIEGLSFGAAAHDWSLIIRRVTPYIILIPISLPGAWRDHPFTLPRIVRATSSGRITSEWRELRRIAIASEPFDARNIPHWPQQASSANFQILNLTQDDAGPVAQVVNWHRRARPRIKRRASEPRLRPTGGFIRERWTIRAHPWMPACHASPIAIAKSRPCSCVTEPVPDGLQYKPFRYSCICLDDIYLEDNAGFVWLDIQETLRWGEYSFLAAGHIKSEDLSSVPLIEY